MDNFEEYHLNNYLKFIGEDKLLSDPLIKSCFIVAYEGVHKILYNVITGFDYEIAERYVPDETYNNIILPVIVPLVKSIKNYQDALEQYMKYGTKITVTTEQMDKLIKDLGNEKG